MKKLQNNFTTPEQSKRLLELGVPADSADMYYQCALDARIIPAGRLYKEYTYSLTGLNREMWYFKPCWSVGRLIEIFLLCTPYNEISLHNENLAEQMIVSIFMVHKDNLIDFSRLEDCA